MTYDLNELDHISIIQFYRDEINYHMEAIKEIEQNLLYFQGSGVVNTATISNYDTCAINVVDQYDDEVIYVYEEEDEPEIETD